MTALAPRAPELPADGWIPGPSLRLADLRGRIVLLDFWTLCCINCLHVIPELHELEEQYADVLTVIGVHSPKFDHERDIDAVRAAVARNHLAHPVVVDPDLRVWRAYGARAWPTLVLIDPEGRIASHLAGEGHGPGLARHIDQLIEQFGLRAQAPSSIPDAAAPPTFAPGLRFPAGIAATSDGCLVVADAGQHCLTVLMPGADPEPQHIVRRLGGPQAGWRDGHEPLLREPNGVDVVPAAWRSLVDFDLLVADTANHAIRAVRLSDGEVWTVAGTGAMRQPLDPTPPDLTPPDQHTDLHPAGAATSDAWASAPPSPTQIPLSSPWDVACHPTEPWAAIAMAGSHQIWQLDFAAAPESPGAARLSVLVGEGMEGLRDGVGKEAWLAQPSALSWGPDGALWVADAESSALRVVRGAAIETVVGAGLYDFGHVDGPAAGARAQHPLGVLAVPDGTVLFSDTYNGALRRYDPATGQVSTLVTGLAEPCGLALMPMPDAGPAGCAGSARDAGSRADVGTKDDAGPGARAWPVGDRGPATPGAARALPEARATITGQGMRAVFQVAVVESAAHRVTVLDLAEHPGEIINGGARQAERPPTALAAGPLDLRIAFTPPPGMHVDDRYGPATTLEVSATPTELLEAGAGVGNLLERELRLREGTGVLHVSARAACCDAEAEFPACHLLVQDWGVPVVVGSGGESRLTLSLRGAGGA